MQDEHEPIDCDISERAALAAEGFEPLMPAPFATDARPGSEAKIRILMMRHSKRMELHHPEDAPLDDEDAPSTWLKDKQAAEEAELDFYMDFEPEAGHVD